MNKLIAIVVGVALLLGSFVYSISRYLPLADPLKKADAIVAISGGDTDGRAAHAIKLYKEGWAPEIIFSGAAKDPSSPSNAKVMKSKAIKADVPAEDIVVEETSENTAQNAQKSRAFVGSAQSIILVTSDYHQRRASHEFKKAYHNKITIINAPANDKNWGQKSWFLTPYGWWISITEPLKLLFSYLPLA